MFTKVSNILPGMSLQYQHIRKFAPKHKRALKCTSSVSHPSQVCSLRNKFYLGNFEFQVVKVSCLHMFLSAGDRAEGAEATLESSLNKLTLTVAQEEEGNSGDD